MALVKIFWQQTCPNCPPAKALGKKLEEDGVKVEYYDVRDADGLTEAAMRDVMATPSILVCEGENEIAAWRNITPTYEEVKKHV